MSDDTITIEVDGKPYEAKKGQMLIEVTDANDIYVPRFCYHKNLSVAANCRMCLVEVEKAPKPLPACATPVMDGMKVSTKSAYAVEAQKSVMEFLLINHPLDCPICDQGGECELQDLAMGYGRDVSRYQEQKRVVQDKNIGPLVQTDMTRCIHCTRCVRFGEEIAGLQELGATGRGEHMLIGTYIEKSMCSELSGNIIDLCPVGALTSKPFRFSARSWEMAQYNGIAPHDAVGSNIYFHVKDDRVKRVVPAENEMINEVWISDRDRFSYEGLYSDDRLLAPMLKENGEWQQVDWQTAFQTIKERLEEIIATDGANRIGALAAPTSTCEELYLLQKLMRGLGCHNIDHRIHQVDFTDQDVAPLFPWLGMPIAELEALDAALLIGAYPRKEQPMINHRLRKAVLKGADIMLVNSVDYEFNYRTSDKLISSPGVLPAMLAAIVKVLLESNNKGVGEDVERLVNQVQVEETHRQIAGKLASAETRAVLLGNVAVAHPQFSAIRYLADMIARLTHANFGYMSGHANTVGACLVGALPHRTVAGLATNNTGLNATSMFEEQLSAYVLLNLEPELDCWDGQLALTALQAASCVIAMTPYMTTQIADYADILLPVAHYAENEGTIVNVEGVRQGFSSAVTTVGESRPAWKVLRVLGNTLNQAGFDYNTVNEITDELAGMLDDIKPGLTDGGQLPGALSIANGSLQRMTDFQMNSADSLVRRASALQQTRDVADGAVHINNESANKLGISTEQNVLVKQNGVGLQLPLLIDDRLPDNTVLIHAAHPACYALGPWFGDITLERC
ncbi:MAG: NADH-quinone oxidoreductase subunit NuoG [Gammaproteobacteria bacterium]|nr:NADH-quinone oxidoreductase subunit NuoG [Gammaproteobacteria bacterium]